MDFETYFKKNFISEIDRLMEEQDLKSDADFCRKSGMEIIMKKVFIWLIRFYRKYLSMFDSYEKITNGENYQ
mgnify:CR=1 FL=1